MEHFKSRSRLENTVVKFILEERIRCKTKPWTKPLASALYHISQWVVEPCRLSGETDFREQFPDDLVYLHFADHNTKFFTKLATFEK